MPAGRSGATTTAPDMSIVHCPKLLSTSRLLIVLRGDYMFLVEIENGGIKKTYHNVKFISCDTYNKGFEVFEKSGKHHFIQIRTGDKICLHIVKNG